MRKWILLITAVLFMGLLIKNDWWAEPKPDSKIQTAFSVAINRKAYTMPETELVVNEIVDEVAEEEYFDSLELLACCIQAEAGNQDLYGKRLVCAVVLNRVDNDKFPNTIEEVIGQEGQFSVVSNGRINKIEPSEETWQAITLELAERSNSEIMYFNAGNYSKSGKPWQKVGDHYFSTL